MKSTKSILTITFLFFAFFLILIIGWNSASAKSVSSYIQSVYPQITHNDNMACDSLTYSNDTQCAIRKDPAQESGIEPQQSKTGPNPSPSILENDKNTVADSLNDILSEVTLAVPAYLWRHGSGPTALGMIVGYYDTQGYRDLIVGSAYSQTEEVNQMIASGGEIGNPNPPGNEEHYEDYASPQDDSPTLLDDSYITEGRTPHADNSLADFMDTSKSTRGNYYGWSWSSDMGPAFAFYVNSRNSEYQTSTTFFYNNSLTWDVLTNEIDSRRPMVFLVDSDGNGSTDHFVTAIGYRTSPRLQYAVWDTWSTTVIRWQNFEYMKSGVPWGIWGGWSFNIEGEVINEVFHVKPDMAGDCSSWDNACDLQTALYNAVYGDQIWVAAGTYKPTSETDRTATFQLKSSVALYGGFPADGGEWETRDWETNITILSGDIGSDSDNSNNSYHVVTGSGVDATAVLNGLLITDGNANGEGYPVDFDKGGGMFNENGNPSLTNVTFSHNTASRGGGMSNSSSSPSLTNVTFIGNSASDFGGGMYNENSSSPTLTNVTFSSNSASSRGGGMFSHWSSAILTNVTFSGNTASYGGGMSNVYQCYPILTNVTFSGNSATVDGGGMYNYSRVGYSLTNVTFSGNSAGNSGGGIYEYFSLVDSTLTNVTFSNNSATYAGGGISHEDGNLTVNNSIFWGNSPEQIISTWWREVTVTYSDIQYGYTGIGNIDSDPFLAPLANNGGFTLTHALGENSPAIDAGDPNSCPAADQRGFFRPIGDGDGNPRCDMGAYEYGSTGPVISHFLPIILK